MDGFRANLVVEGLEPCEEKGLDRL